MRSGKAKKKQLQEKRERKRHEVPFWMASASASAAPSAGPSAPRAPPTALLASLGQSRARGGDDAPDRLATLFAREDSSAVRARRALAPVPLDVRARALGPPRAHERASFDAALAFPKGLLSSLAAARGAAGSAAYAAAGARAGEEALFREWLSGVYAEYARESLSAFEHNVDVWMQLWHTLATADVVALVADARNPLWHVPASLYEHVTGTLGKPLVLVLNKADLVPPAALGAWVAWLSARFPRAKVVTFSASGALLEEGAGLAGRRRELRDSRKAYDAETVGRRADSAGKLLAAAGVDAVSAAQVVSRILKTARAAARRADAVLTSDAITGGFIFGGNGGESRGSARVSDGGDDDNDDDYDDDDDGTNNDEHNIDDAGVSEDSETGKSLEDCVGVVANYASSDEKVEGADEGGAEKGCGGVAVTHAAPVNQVAETSSSDEVDSIGIGVSAISTKVLRQVRIAPPNARLSVPLNSEGSVLRVGRVSGASGGAAGGGGSGSGGGGRRRRGGGALPPPPPRPHHRDDSSSDGDGVDRFRGRPRHYKRGDAAGAAAAIESGFRSSIAKRDERVFGDGSGLRDNGGSSEHPATASVGGNKGRRAHVGGGGGGGGGRAQNQNDDDDRDTRKLQTAAEPMPAASRRAPLIIGMVGHPNVGKSSVINTLCGEKRVSVSRTAGHTKRAQTIPLADGVTLLDCPGLVFPHALGPPRGAASAEESSGPLAYVQSTTTLPTTLTLEGAETEERAMQECCGVVPLAQVREPFTALRFLGEHLPLERLYGLTPDRDDLLDAIGDGVVGAARGAALATAAVRYSWSPHSIAEALAVKRGILIAKSGQPDAHAAGRAILYDAQDGVLPIYWMPPMSCGRGESQSELG